MMVMIISIVVVVTLTIMLVMIIGMTMMVGDDHYNDDDKCCTVNRSFNLEVQNLVEVQTQKYVKSPIGFPISKHLTLDCRGESQIVPNFQSDPLSGQNSGSEIKSHELLSSALSSGPLLLKVKSCTRNFPQKCI